MLIDGSGLTTRTRITTPFAPTREQSVALAPENVAQLKSFGPLDTRSQQNPAYDSVATYLNAVASGWAYSDADAMALVLSKYALREVKVVTLAIANAAMLVDVEAYVVSAKQGERSIGIICFRGTEFGGPELTDAFTDANALLVANQNIASGGGSRAGKVHKGFHRSALYIWDYLRAAMEAAFMQDGEVALDALYVTGHSLGAAVAVIVGENLYNDAELEPYKAVLRGVYTFGQPAAGDAVYAAECERSGYARMVYRHVYDSDWVPTLPPFSTGDYRHFGQALVSTERGWEMSSKTPLRALTIVGSGLLAAGAFFSQRFVVGRWLTRLLQLKFSLEDHLPDHYVDVSWRSLPQP
jgi:hypothetical protein